MPFRCARIWVAALMAALTAQALGVERTELTPLVEANNAFALQLYGKLRSTEDNLAFSPYGISSSLAMAYAGARGETARQMEQTLHFDQYKERVHEVFGRLRLALKSAQDRNELSVANSLWPQTTYPILEEYLRVLKSDYGATITPLDYLRDSQSARARINHWVDVTTRHKITEIIGPADINGLTRMVLVNAIYFKGAWASPFPGTSTRIDKFYAQPDRPLTASFMHDCGHFSYAENDQLQVLSLPYIGLRLGMVILLPRRRDGIGQLENNLTTTNLTEWISAMRDEKVNVALPKFKISSGFNLAKALEALGLKDAFDPFGADFSGMNGRAHSLRLSAALHRVEVEVNEKGTEAAAATALVFDTSAVRIQEPPREFRADHPFLFLIRDSTTGSLLFVGRVVQPGA